MKITKSPRKNSFFYSKRKYSKSKSRRRVETSVQHNVFKSTAVFSPSENVKHRKKIGLCCCCCSCCSSPAFRRFFLFFHIFFLCFIICCFQQLRNFNSFYYSALDGTLFFSSIFMLKRVDAPERDGNFILECVLILATERTL